MYNTGSFNKLRFNIGAEDDSEFRLIENMYASFSGMVLTGGNLFVTQTANNSFHSAAMLAAGVRMGAVAMISGVSASISGCAYFFLAAQMGGIFNSEFWCSQNINVVSELSAVMQRLAHVGLDKSIGLAMAAVLQKRIMLSIDFYQNTLIMSSIVDAQITTSIFDISYVNLDITIHPGQTLVIDSDNFIVLLDGEDAINAHSGAWPWLSRELFDIQISSGAVSDLETSVLYTERYL